MKLFLLCLLTMVAFAANSVLNKFGVSAGGMDPSLFALVRILAGAVVLTGLLVLRDGGLTWVASGRWAAVLSLSAYMCGFSLAYLTLDAGAGALILFGMVQVTMFLAAILRGDLIPALRWAGMAVAFGGLCVLLWPDGAGGLNLIGSTFMIVAGVGWGIYSLIGAKSSDALAATGANFVIATPLMALVLLPITTLEFSTPGLLSAIASGAITSALGYALWYQVLPRLQTSIAATAQLSVPVIALAGGMLFLGEEVSIRFALAALLVLGGIALSLRR